MRVFLAYLLLSQTALAVPGQFTHQGRLLDVDGMALEDEATITFRIADAESGGTNLWEETQTVSLTNGFYSAILGADEDDNPLDIEVLSQAPVWLELQLDGEGAMFPRSPVHSVPYAAMASVAEELVGGPVDAETVAVGGVPVINEAGEWVGPASAVSWSDIEGMPEDFADGVDDDTDTDSDSLAELATSCLDGDIPVWDAVVEAWACDFDQDTLAAIGCLDGQLIHWSGDSMGWVCADDVDTFLTEEDVDSMVADNGYAMASEVFSGSFLDLVDVPVGLEDGDDDTQLSEGDVDEMVSDNGYAMGTDVFSGSFGDLVDVPAGLEDGDDDTIIDSLPWSAISEKPAILLADSYTGNRWIHLSGRDSSYDGMTALAANGRVRSCGNGRNDFQFPIDSVQVAATVHVVCVLSNDGEISCKPRTTSGASSTAFSAAFPGTYLQIESAVGQICGRSDMGSVVCANDSGAVTIRVSSGATDLSAGSYYGCAIDGDEDLQCWSTGASSYGQYTDRAGSFIDVGAGWSNTCAIRSTGAIACWGRTSSGLTPVPSGSFVSVAVGGEVACALDEEGIATCWGSSLLYHPPNIPLTNLIGMGAQNSDQLCALAEATGEVLCWGPSYQEQANCFH
jgi:hypothetical protein